MELLLPQVAHKRCKSCFEEYTIISFGGFRLLFPEELTIEHRSAGDKSRIHEFIKQNKQHGEDLIKQSSWEWQQT